MGSVEQLLAGIFKSKVLASQGQGGGGGAVQVGEAGGLPAAPWWPASAPLPPQLSAAVFSHLRRQPPIQGWVPPVPRREGTGMRAHQLSYFALLSAASSSGKNSGEDVGNVSLQHPWRYSQRPSPRCSPRPLLYEQVRFQEYQVMK